MNDPCRNAAFESSFTFTGTVSGVHESGKTMQLMIHQDAAGGRMPTDYKLVIPTGKICTEEFPYVPGDIVLVEDALFYIKDSEVRFRIDSMSQIRSTTSRPGEFNALSFSGEIVDVKEEDGYSLVYMEQNVKGFFRTKLELVVPASVRVAQRPKIGDIGYISHAIMYDKGGCFRARLNRPTYRILYTPDIIMDMGTIEAREVFV